MTPKFFVFSRLKGSATSKRNKTNDLLPESETLGGYPPGIPGLKRTRNYAFPSTSNCSILPSGSVYVSKSSFAPFANVIR